MLIQLSWLSEEFYYDAIDPGFESSTIHLFMIRNSKFKLPVADQTIRYKSNISGKNWAVILFGKVSVRA